MPVRLWCVCMQDQKVCMLRQKGKCVCSYESEDNVHYSGGDLLFKYFPGPQTIKDSKSRAWWTAYLHQTHCNGFICFLMRLWLILFVSSSVVDCAGWRSTAAALIFTHTHTNTHTHTHGGLAVTMETFKCWCWRTGDWLWLGGDVACCDGILAKSYRAVEHGKWTGSTAGISDTHHTHTHTHKKHEVEMLSKW